MRLTFFRAFILRKITLLFLDGVYFAIMKVNVAIAMAYDLTLHGDLAFTLSNLWMILMLKMMLNTNSKFGFHANTLAHVFTHTSVSSHFAKCYVIFFSFFITSLLRHHYIILIPTFSADRPDLALRHPYSGAWSSPPTNRDEAVSHRSHQNNWNLMWVQHCRRCRYHEGTGYAPPEVMWCATEIDQLIDCPGVWPALNTGKLCHFHDASRIVFLIT